MSAVISGSDGVTYPTWTTATRPATPTASLQGFNTTTNQMEFYDGTNWIGLSDLRTIPVESKTTSYQLTAADVGETISTNSAITVNGAVLSTGFVCYVYNNSAVSITITQGSGVTLYLSGTSSTGNRTLAQRGLATVYCVASNTFIVSGAGIS